jgi:hypothetical protein
MAPLLIVSANPFISLGQGDAACLAKVIRKELNMKRVMKHIAVAALAVTTMGAGTMQAQAGSDLSRAFVGTVAIGIIADKLDKKSSSRHIVSPRFSSRSFDRSRLRSNQRFNRRVIRRNSHHDFKRTHRSRRVISRRAYGH